MSIITTEELKTYLGIDDATQDELLSIFANGASDYIEAATGRKFALETYEEYHDGAGQMDIVLNNIPVVSTTTVQYNSGTYSAPVWTGFDLDSYNTDKKSGIIMFRLCLYRGFQNIKIVYTAGYATIPGDLKLACLKLAGAQYNTRNSGGVASESVGGDSISFTATGIPGEVLDIISKYINV